MKFLSQQSTSESFVVIDVDSVPIFCEDIPVEEA
jgi:hypothetical protein